MDALIEQVARRLQAVPGLPPAPQVVASAPATLPTEARALARYIDHTLLKPEATPAQVEQLCAEARQHQFASVCVNGGYVPMCAERLQGSGVAVCTVVGFPLGASSSATKVFEARESIANGASEIDMVIAIGRLKGGDERYVYNDIAAVVQACHEAGAICKVIIETALLTDEEKIAATLLVARAGADFVKTSTGFASSGATVADVALLRQVVGAGMGVKAAGGVRSFADAVAMIEAGATRIGTSGGVAIVEGASATGSY